ncbi:MAG TPA: GAF domain-containing protein [Thermomicrobiales bacterium]|jgi:putative methionine-R-sulfoxide reductase with GAF domain
MSESNSGEDALRRARATMAAQQAEIDRLRALVEADRSAEELREALALAAAAGTIGSPVSHDRLLELIVETAAEVIPAGAAHLFLIDDDGDELIFAVAVGARAAGVEGRRLRVNRGLAALVAATGQPMAVADVARDGRLAAQIAADLGYVPANALCVPLAYDERTIGVMQLLDRRGAPSFSVDDVRQLSLFANQAAVAISQSRIYRNLAALVADVVNALQDVPLERRTGLRERAQAFAARLEQPDDVNYREALDLARLVQEIAWHGEREYAACRTLLEGFAAYLRGRPTPASAETR